MNVQGFAAVVQEQQRARFVKDYGAENAADVHKRAWVVTVKVGPKYTRVDVGDSGKYMVVNATGEIFGIKGYGVIHRGHYYGTLETVADWQWGDYHAFRKVVVA